MASTAAGGAAAAETAGARTGEAGGHVPVPLLFLFADTGGGHRAAAQAVGEALAAAYPGMFRPVLVDPLGGPGSPRLLRWVSGGYGPVVRRAPWIWGAAYYVTNSRVAMWVLHRTLLTGAGRVAAAAASRLRPAAIVSFHPLTCRAAAQACRRAQVTAAVTVVTDLATAHTAWRSTAAGHVIVASAAARQRFSRPAAGARCTDLGLPVPAAFTSGPLAREGRGGLRRSLAIPAGAFTVLLAGGAEGCGGIERRARAIVRRAPGVHVVAICGRNRRASRRLGRLAEQVAGRLTVVGFTPSMADWLRCADLVVTKAGPSMIAEAACAGTPMLLTGHLPGQERGNAELAVASGAGRHAGRRAALLREISHLRGDPAAMSAMRAGCARLARPAAAADTATVIAGLSGMVAAPRQRDANDPHTQVQTAAGRALVTLGPSA